MNFLAIKSKNTVSNYYTNKYIYKNIEMNFYIIYRINLKNTLILS